MGSGKRGTPNPARLDVSGWFWQSCDPPWPKTARTNQQNRGGTLDPARGGHRLRQNWMVPVGSGDPASHPGTKLLGKKNKKQQNRGGTQDLARGGRRIWQNLTVTTGSGDPSTHPGPKLLGEASKPDGGTGCGKRGTPNPARLAV